MRFFSRGPCGASRIVGAFSGDLEGEYDFFESVGHIAGKDSIPVNLRGWYTSRMRRLFTRLGFAALALTAFTSAWADFTLTILHTNDLHAHVEPVRVKGKSVGGYARQATALLQLKEESENPILLNAGDTFQGTLYFNAYEGLVDLTFMNLVGYQAMAVGNHEFDRGVDAFANFARLANFPLLSANLDVSKEAKLEKLVQPSTVLEVGGERVGVVGAITPSLPEISSPGPTVGLKDYVKSVQAAVNDLTKRGINKIILLNHSGWELDQSAAKQLYDIDIVVGGHSHTLLGHVDIPEFDGSQGEYPLKATDAKGKEVLIVQAWEWGKVIGKMKLVFDDKGIVKSYEGAPVLIDDSYIENPFVTGMLTAFKKPIEDLQKQPVAELANDLNRMWSPEGGDSLMGSVISDAALEATKNAGAVAAFWNSGGVRSELTAGKITYGQLIEVCPFGNQLTVLELTGKELKGAIEHGLSGGGFLLPSKGFEYTFNINAATGKQLVSAKLNGVEIKDDQKYRVTVNNFTASGGDGHVILRDAKGTRIETGLLDLDALIDYFKANAPVKMTNEGRVKAIK